MSEAIESAILEVALGILRGDGFGYDVPSRAKGNQVYVPELDRIVLKDASSFRAFASMQTCRKTTIMTRIMQLVHELCQKGIHVTKRDLFYTDVKLFEDQGQVRWEHGVQRPRRGGQLAGGPATSMGTLCARSRTLCWTTSPACWGARGHLCTSWRRRRGSSLGA